MALLPGHQTEPVPSTGGLEIARLLRGGRPGQHFEAIGLDTGGVVTSRVFAELGGFQVVYDGATVSAA